MIDLRNFDGIELRNFNFTTVLKLFSKISPEVGKCITWDPVLVLLNQVSKKSFHTFENIDLRESHAKLHKKPSETLGADSF